MTWPIVKRTKQMRITLHHRSCRPPKLQKTWFTLLSLSYELDFSESANKSDILGFSAKISKRNKFSNFVPTQGLRD